MKSGVGEDNPFFVARAGLILALRGLGITERRLLEAFETVPHEAFVPADYAEYAYKDASLPIGGGQSITSPMILGRLLFALDAADSAKILEIGTGSGYSAALLSRLGRRVFTLEKDRALLGSAMARWRDLRADNIVGIAADGPWRARQHGAVRPHSAGRLRAGHARSAQRSAGGRGASGRRGRAGE